MCALVSDPRRPPLSPRSSAGATSGASSATAGAAALAGLRDVPTASQSGGAASWFGGGGGAKARELPKFTKYVPAPEAPVTFEPLAPLEIIYPVRTRLLRVPAAHPPPRARVGCRNANASRLRTSAGCRLRAGRLRRLSPTRAPASLPQDVFNETSPTCTPAKRMDNLGPPRQMRWIADPESKEWPVNCDKHEELCKGARRRPPPKSPGSPDKRQLFSCAPRARSRNAHTPTNPAPPQSSARWP